MAFSLTWSCAYGFVCCDILFINAARVEPVFSLYHQHFFKRKCTIILDIFPFHFLNRKLSFHIFITHTTYFLLLENSILIRCKGWIEAENFLALRAFTFFRFIHFNIYIIIFMYKKNINKNTTERISQGIHLHNDFLSLCLRESKCKHRKAIMLPIMFSLFFPITSTH